MYTPPAPKYRVQWFAPSGQLQWHVCPTVEQAKALVAAIHPHEIRGGTVPRICLIDDPMAVLA